MIDKAILVIDMLENCDHTRIADMARIAISAMHELQEYKKLGTWKKYRK